MTVDDSARDSLIHEVDNLLAEGHAPAEVQEALDTVASRKSAISNKAMRPAEVSEAGVAAGARALIARLRATRDGLPHGV